MTSQPPLIGLVVEGLDAPYQSGMWEGARAAAHRHGVHVVAVCGGTLDFSPSNQWERTRNRIYERIGPDILDGVIVATSVGNFTSPERMDSLVRAFAGIPAVAVGCEREGMAGIVVDNARGIKALVRHLVEDHDYRRFAYIGGPSNSAEALQRYAIFRAALDEHQVSFDETTSLVAGDFTREAGYAAAQRIVTENPQCQCIVGCNDEAALGALDYLQREPPGSAFIAVVGFDDIEESRYAHPTLTTVSQPADEIGKAAVEAVLAMLRGESVPPRTIVSTSLVVRRSCGCPAGTKVGAFQPHDEPALGENHLQARFVGPLLRHRLAGRFDGISQSLLDTMVDAYCSDVNSREATRFPSSLECVAEALVRASIDPLSGNDLLSHLRRLSWERLSGAALAHAEELLHVGCRLLSESARRAEGARRIGLLRAHSCVHKTGLSLFRHPDRLAIASSIEEALPHLGIHSCTIDSGSEAPSVRQALDNGRENVPWGSCYVASCLTFRDEQLGIALFRAGEAPPAWYGILIDYLGTALHMASLVESFATRQPAGPH